MPGVCRPAGTAGERRLQRHKEITQSYQWCCFAYEGGAGWRGTIYLPLHDSKFLKSYFIFYFIFAGELFVCFHWHRKSALADDPTTNHGLGMTLTTNHGVGVRTRGSGPRAFQIILHLIRSLTFFVFACVQAGVVCVCLAQESALADNPTAARAASA